jgi:hypothetical protein
VFDLFGVEFNSRPTYLVLGLIGVELIWCLVSLRNKYGDRIE